jgi:hypothetical protein
LTSISSIARIVFRSIVPESHMQKRRLPIITASILIAGVLSATAVVAWAQGRKAGLWEVTSTTTLQQSPFPPGMTPPSGSPLAPGARTTQVCLTQAMIDKFGGPAPQNGECQFTDLKKSDHGMSAELVCSGRMTGKGTFESSWTDSEHAKATVHVTGTAQGRGGPVPIEFTRESTSVFKSPDCGDVKPLSIPDGK